MSRIFALLLNTKVDTTEKIKRILKIDIETTIKIWQEPRQQGEECMLILSAHLKKKLKKDSLFVQNKGNISPALLPRFFVGKKKDKTNATKIKATKKISMDTKTNRDVQIHTHKHPPTNPHTHTHTHTHAHTEI